MTLANYPASGEQCPIGKWFNRHGGVDLTVGLDDLGGLFQPMIPKAVCPAHPLAGALQNSARSHMRNKKGLFVPSVFQVFTESDW